MATPTSNGKIRVLLIDDDPDDHVLTRDLFSEIPGDKFELAWVSDYEAGIEAICAGEHDVFLLDYRLGERTGLELLAEAMQRTCHGPVILLTGQSMLEIDMAAMEQGVADYLEKGRLDATILERSIRYAIQQARYEAELKKQVAARTKDLEIANAALKDADRRKNQFLATLAHELRNPLAPIRNALQIMKIAKDNPTVIEQSRAIVERQVRHMIRHIDDLLDISRITRGKLVLQFASIDIHEAIAAAIETSEPVLDEAQVTLELHVSEEPIIVHGDRLRLGQVFANLLNNAAKYTEPGGKVMISSSQDGEHAVVHVKDTGLGIPAEVLPQVFKPFTQVNRTLSRSQGGLGIGLALVEQIVQLHGGIVTAYSEGVGKGAEFIVRLPLEGDANPEA